MAERFRFDMYYENKRIENLKVNGKALEGTEFSECVFKNCAFEDCQINSCMFLSCRFIDCDIIRLKARDSQISLAEFSKCNLIGIQWDEFMPKKKMLEPIRKLTNCFLKYNTFADVNFIRFDFSNNTIQESIFDECILKESNFKGCRLEGTQYWNCDLQKADFREAGGYQIDLMTNRLKEAKFSFPDVINLLNSLEIKID